MKKTAFCLIVTILILLMAPNASAAADTLAVERQVYTYLTEELGLSTAAACGVLANIEHESAFQPTVVGDQGTSYGLCQWHNERYTALRAYCGAMGLNYRTVEGQMAYLKYELGNHYTELLLTLRSLDNTPQSAYRAGYLWCIKFERPMDMEIKAAQRGNLARGKYWNRYNSISVVILPQEEPEPPSTDVLVEYLIQNPVTIPMPPQEEGQTGTKRYQAEKPPMRTYTPWHSPEPVEETGSGLAWGIPALAAIGLAAAAVVLWPVKKAGREKTGSGKL